MTATRVNAAIRFLIILEFEYQSVPPPIIKYRGAIVTTK